MGYQLMKVVARPDHTPFNGYMIIEPMSDFAVGNARGDYGLDLDDVEAWAREHGHAAVTRGRVPL